MSDLLSEIAARYGVPVAPEARVQVVPRGVSGLPQVVYDQDVGRLFLDGRDGTRGQRWRSVALAGCRRRRAGVGYNEAELAERRAAVAEGHAAGMTAHEIARAIGALVRHVQSDLRLLGLDGVAVPRQAPVVCAVDVPAVAPAAVPAVAPVPAVRARAPRHTVGQSPEGRARVDLIRRLAADGVCADEIAAQLGRDVETVRGIAKAHKITLRRKLRAVEPAVQARRDKLRALVAAGPVCPEAAAAALGVTPQTARRVAASLGVELLRGRTTCTARPEDAVALAREGVPVGEICARVGRQRTWVYRALRDAGIAPPAVARKRVEAPRADVPSVSWTDGMRAARDARRARVLELHRAGVAFDDMRVALGISSSTLADDRRALGISTRESGAAPLRSTSSQVEARVHARRERLVALWADGPLTWREAARALGISAGTLAGDLRATGLVCRGMPAKPRGVLTPALRAEIMRRVAAGASVRSVAAALRLGATTVRRALAQASGAANDMAVAA